MGRPTIRKNLISKRDDIMKENYLYFSEGGGANATTEAGCFACSRLRGVFPSGGVTGVATTIAFDGTTNVGDNGEYVTITHTDLSGSRGHIVRRIAAAVARSCNNASHNEGTITILDFDTKEDSEDDLKKLIYLGHITALAITLDS